MPIFLAVENMFEKKTCIDERMCGIIITNKCLETLKG